MEISVRSARHPVIKREKLLGVRERDTFGQDMLLVLYPKTRQGICRENLPVQRTDLQGYCCCAFVNASTPSSFPG